MIGKLITFLELLLRKIFPKTKDGEQKAGFVLVVLVCGISVFTVWGLMKLAYDLNFWCGFLLEVIMCYQLFAVRSLKDESMKVYKELVKSDLEASRKAVSMIVGRDTQSLTVEGVTKAAVETIAENTSDGTLAPMLYMFIGGPVLGWFYKAVNTMDSMVGYKNEKYIHFGRYAAKFDDVMNYIPARLCGLLMIFASYILKMDWKNAKKIFLRDRFNHASPNSAQTEAVMAGALRIQLAGDAWYFGKRYEKPTIGDALRPVEIEDIPRANRLLYATAIVSFIIFGIVQLLLQFIRF
ncbi:MAG: cobalamin biosynthesis protein CobD [Lachnospiraceae bacterium]|nr:cobalamin biosynthesis protein CobD [Lachnospiraceae bacterium]